MTILFVVAVILFTVGGIILENRLSKIEHQLWKSEKRF